MEPNVCSGLVREAGEASGKQVGRKPCLWPLKKCSPAENCSFCGVILPWQAAGLGGSPWFSESSTGQCEPGSRSPAFRTGSQKPEALAKEEDLAEALPSRLLLQQPPCLLDPQQGAPQQEAQTSEPGSLSQCSLPAAPN